MRRFLRILCVVIAATLPGAAAEDPIFALLREGNFLKVVAYLKANPSAVGATDGTGGTPLHAVAAMAEPRIDLLQILLAAGADPNARNGESYLQTPLFLAVGRGHESLVSLLLAAGADPSIGNKVGITPVELANRNGSQGVLKALLSKKTELDIFEAAVLGKTERVRELVNAKPQLVDAKDAMGFNVLQIAALNHRKEVVAYLRSMGVRMDMFNAAAAGATEVLEREILRNPASVKVADPKGFAALDWAIAAGELTAAQYLTDHGADVNRSIPGSGGNTALHYAAGAGDLEMVRFLLVNGADARRLNAKGRTPRDVARLMKHTEVADLLP